MGYVELKKQAGDYRESLLLRQSRFVPGHDVTLGTSPSYTRSPFLLQCILYFYVIMFIHQLLTLPSRPILSPPTIRSPVPVYAVAPPFGSSTPLTADYLAALP